MLIRRPLLPVPLPRGHTLFRNVGGGSRLVEKSYVLSVGEDRLDLVLTFHTNGVLTGEDRWSLKR